MSRNFTSTNCVQFSECLGKGFGICSVSLLILTVAFQEVASIYLGTRNEDLRGMLCNRRGRLIASFTRTTCNVAHSRQTLSPVCLLGMFLRDPPRTFHALLSPFINADEHRVRFYSRVAHTCFRPGGIHQLCNTVLGPSINYITLFLATIVLSD